MRPADVPVGPPVKPIASRLRASPRLTLIPFAGLPAAERAGFGALPDNPALFGALRDERGALKVLDHESARLLADLAGPPRVAAELDADETSLARLVLDGVLEVESGAGEFVSGSRAYGLVCEVAATPEPTTKTARLSHAALRHAEGLELDDPLRLSARLYFYGRLPLSPAWSARLPTRESVARFLGTEGRTALAQTLRRSWRAVSPEAPNDGWFMWSRRAPSPARGGDRFKLYVSPQPDAVPAAFGAAVAAAEAAGAEAFKIGNDAASLLRPDKLVVYFDDLERVRAAAARIRDELGGCPAHGVPFTAEVGDCGGLLSWGLDPPRSEQLLDWQERESWRLWLTNRLAVALLAARRDGGPLEPWRYALARIRFEGIDPATWTPLGDVWDEAA